MHILSSTFCWNSTYKIKIELQQSCIPPVCILPILQLYLAIRGDHQLNSSSNYWTLPQLGCVGFIVMLMCVCLSVRDTCTLWAGGILHCSSCSRLFIFKCYWQGRTVSIPCMYAHVRSHMQFALLSNKATSIQPGIQTLPKTLRLGLNIRHP